MATRRPESRPLRDVVSVTLNYSEGTNYLTLTCGHTVSRPYNNEREQKRARCDLCRLLAR